MSTSPKIRADFNGLFSQLLCLSHEDTTIDENGQIVTLAPGMRITAFDEDAEDGKPDNLLASGIVEPSPDWLGCRGSRWVLRIDEHGVRRESDLLQEKSGGL